MKPSARKSHGEYKPIIIHGCGRTEVIGQRGTIQNWVALTNSGETYYPRRGITFTNREDALACAQRAIDRRVSFRAQRRKQLQAEQATNPKKKG